MKRWVAVLLVVGMVAVLAGVAVGLAVSPDRSPAESQALVPPPDPQPGSEVAPDAALADYYGQRPEWRACGAFECATIDVPLDYADPIGPSIELALLKRPASDTSRRVGSLVVNPGGPGAPGTDYAAGAGQVFRDELTDRFDVVGFDPRGTGDSDPVDCLSDAELDALIATDPAPDTPSEVRALVGKVRQFGQGCETHSGDVVAHVSTIEAARDMDVLRSALGENTLTYFGASYGTKLGATYADLFPDRVGRLVLDGAVDLRLNLEELSLQQAAGFQTALESYVRDCVDADEPCFLGDSVEQGLDRIEQLLADIDAQPLPAGDREVTSGHALYGVIMPLYNQDLWFLLTRALQEALDGTGTTLLLLSDSYTSRDLGGDGYLNNMYEANLAINCLDDPESVAAVRVPRLYDEFEAASRTFGRTFAWQLLNCRGFRVRSAEPPREVQGAGADPILVIGTTRDPATPVQWATSLAEQLESGVLVTRDGDGHTAYNAGNACLDTTVEDYLLNGVVPQDGLAC